MSIFKIGRLAMKIAGRDAGRKCAVVEMIDDNFVLVDGDVRRKRVNLKHLEPLEKTIDIKDGASHADVKAAFEKLGLHVWDKKSKKPAERPKRQKKKKEAPAKVEKKAEKKVDVAPVEEKPLAEEPKAEETEKPVEAPVTEEKKE